MEKTCQVTRLGVLHNPNSRQSIRHPEIGAALQKAVSDTGIFASTNRLEDLPRAIDTFQEAGVDLIAVIGGDGTLHKFLSEAVPRWKGDFPPVAILRGGTMNTVSTVLGMKGKPEAVVKKLAEACRQRQSLTVLPHRLMNVNGLLGFMSGAGVVVRFLDNYYGSTETGPVAAARMVARLIGSALMKTGYARDLFDAEPMTVTVDGHTLPAGAFRVILGCVVQDIGLGCKATPLAYAMPGAFHFACGAIGPGALVTQVHRLWTGRLVKHPDLYWNGPAKTVRITGNRPLRWMMDGERYESPDGITLSTGPFIRLVKY